MKKEAKKAVAAKPAKVRKYKKELAKSAIYVVKDDTVVTAVELTEDGRAVVTYVKCAGAKTAKAEDGKPAAKTISKPQTVDTSATLVTAVTLTEAGKLVIKYVR